MSKKLKDMQWQPVALEGFPISMSDSFQGFVGLEEYTHYGLDKESKRSKKKKAQKQRNQPIENQESAKTKQQKKRKSPPEPKSIDSPAKKIRLSNGFVVESFTSSIGPSQTNDLLETSKNNNKKGKKKNKKKAPVNKPKTEVVTTEEVTKKPKPKLGEVTTQTVSDLTAEDMLTWSEYKLQEPIMKALTELGFKNPTKIQQLTLPAAIHGRRDILGAAETGSGKTLAFGLPILSGILKLKEKAAAKGLDVYNIPFKKGSAKKKNIPEDNTKEKSKNNQKKTKKGQGRQNTVNKSSNAKKPEVKPKESSEDGYSSGDSNSDSEKETNKLNIPSNKNIKELKSNKRVNIINKNKKPDDDFLEEIEVPIRKRNNSADEGNDSDDDNYIHLSEMLDSDDLADSDSEIEKDENANSDEETESDDGKAESNDDEADSDDNEAESDIETESGDEIDDDAQVNKDDESGVEDNDGDVVLEDDDDEDVVLGDDDDEDVVLGGDEEDEVLGGDEDLESKTAGGIGCVKVIDDIEMPEQVVVKTGKPLYALILTPTRELAIQISRHLIAAARYTGIKIATIVGGMAAVKQERVLRSGPEVVVATPGRLWELIGQGQPHLQQLGSVKFLAIDETDRMIERGHFEELHPLLERLNMDEERKSARQNFVFSATLTLVHELPSHMKGKKVTKRGKIINRKIEKMTPQQKVKRLVEMIGMTDPKVVDITAQNFGTAETLTECRITCSLEHKDAYLYYIIKRHPGRSIVFCNSIGSVRRLAQIFTILKCNPLPLHASMPQRQRLKNLERFRDNPHGVLIATDVAARGLDIPDIDHVIQYQVPRTAENYVHRSGRTARANKEGINVLMVEPSEAYLYSKLCLTLNKTSEVPSFPVATHILSPLKELVSIARELDALELKKKRTAQAMGWREKAARDMDMIIDDDDVPVQSSDPATARALKAKRRQLDAMLSRPIFPRGFSFKYPSLNEPDALSNTDDNALQVMKKALESGELKKEMRKSKNAPLLKLGKEGKINKSKGRRNKSKKK